MSLGESPPGLVNMLARHFRILTKVKELLKRNKSEKVDTAFRLASPYIPVKPDITYTLSFEERHNYDFSKVTKGYCKILWYDSKKT